MTLVNTRGFVTHELHDNSGWLVTRTRTKTAIRHEVNCNSTHRHLSSSSSHNPPVSGTGEARRDDRCVSSCRDHSPVVMTWSRPRPQHFPGTIVHPHQLSFGHRSHVSDIEHAVALLQGARLQRSVLQRQRTAALQPRRGCCYDEPD